MSTSPAPQPGGRVVVRSSRREILIGIAIGAVLLALVIVAVLNMGAKVSGKGLTGRITEKHFTPEEPSTEITIGKGGVSRREVDGTCKFVVWVEAEKKYYTIWDVPKSAYESHKVGDDYYFIRPSKK
jgi:hypothetical protein